MREYGVNSTELKQLLKDLTEASAVADLATTNLARWVAALTDAQTEFEDAEKAAADFEKSQPQDRPVAQIRGDFNQVFRLILGNLGWRAERGEEGYAERFNAIRKLVVDLRSNVRGRENRADSEEGEDVPAAQEG